MKKLNWPMQPMETLPVDGPVLMRYAFTRKECWGIVDAAYVINDGKTYTYKGSPLKPGWWPLPDVR